MTPNADIQRIATDRAPTPAGHYAQATVYGGLVHVAGQLPVLPDGTHDPSASFETQTRRALANLLAIVEAAGSSPERILKATVYIVGIDHWPAFNAIYAEMLGAARPARSVVPVPELHFGYLVEIDAVAAAAET